jgi:hypothetical protein
VQTLDGTDKDRVEHLLEMAVEKLRQAEKWRDLTGGN